MPSVDLVATVCESGGLASFGVHHQDSTQILQTAIAIRARTKRQFALNLWIPMDDIDESDISDETLARNASFLRPYSRSLVCLCRLVPSDLDRSTSSRSRHCWKRGVQPGIWRSSPAVVHRCKDLGIATMGAATTTDEAIFLDWLTDAMKPAAIRQERADLPRSGQGMQHRRCVIRTQGH